MSGILRKTQQIFGANGIASPTGILSQFGSLAAAAPIYSADPAVIQALSAWAAGWASANIITGSPPQPVPPMQDMNAALFVATYQLAYLLERGMAEWDTGTTYANTDFCRIGMVLYVSQADNNTGNNPATDSGANWQPYTSLIRGPAFSRGWVRFDCTGPSPVIIDSFNVASVGYSAFPGNILINWQNPFPNANYGWTASMQQIDTSSYVDSVSQFAGDVQSTTQLQVRVLNGGTSVGTTSPNVMVNAFSTG